MGVAVAPQELKDPAAAALVLKHFNSLTAENAMKPESLQPRQGVFNWAGADSIVAFAQRNGLKMRGHTLCWHNQTPAWFFTDAAGKEVSKDTLLQRLHNHIVAVVGRYKGKVYAWDVVNEAISDKAGEYLRPSAWYRICGEEYIEKAFLWAHEADPNALLFYNDYNEISDVKRAKILRLIASLKEKGIPISGIGLQGHWAINEPSAQQLEKTLQDFAQTNLPLQITELDMSVYKKEHNARARTAADSDTLFTTDKAAAQAALYKDWFALFRKYKQAITSVTFWNISDRASWLDNFPVKNRKDYPLLFDKDFNEKPAYKAVTIF